MKAELRPRARQIVELTNLCQAHPKIIIHGKSKTGVQRCDAQPEVPPPQGCLLRDVNVAASQSGIVGLGSGKATNDAAAGIYVTGVSVNHAHLGMIFQKIDGLTNSSVIEAIIGV